MPFVGELAKAFTKLAVVGGAASAGGAQAGAAVGVGFVAVEAGKEILKDDDDGTIEAYTNYAQTTTRTAADTVYTSDSTGTNASAEFTQSATTTPSFEIDPSLKGLFDSGLLTVEEVEPGSQLSPGCAVQPRSSQRSQGMQL